MVDRIDPVEKKIQFAVVEEEPVREVGKRGSGGSKPYRALSGGQPGALPPLEGGWLHMTFYIPRDF